MTDSCEDGGHLVRVRAQVMIRDDSTGGWVPMAGGGLSYVSVRKRNLDQQRWDYVILGQRVTDMAIVLSCVIKRDFEYNKVMPTFHHWKTGDKKFGLTFQTAADARAFDKGLRTAVDELLDGMSDPLMALHNRHVVEMGDDDVFMTLDLPVDREESRASSDSSRESRHPTPPRAKLTSEHESPPDPSHLDICPYVQLMPAHHPHHHAHLDPSCPLKKDASLETVKKRGGLLGGRDSSQLCHYCRERYVEDNNYRGACEFAPDCARSLVNWVACMHCANGMVYNCMADSEGQFTEEPCDCTPEDGCTKRWLGLSLLSMLVPCLCLYPPLRACHMGCVRCGLAGGRHRPAS